MKTLRINDPITNHYNGNGDIISFNTKGKTMKKFEHGIRYKDGSGVPLMPEMKWNADGTANFDDLETDTRPIEQHNLRKADGSGVPLMPVARWNADGTPSFEHLTENTTNDNFDVVLSVLKTQYHSVGAQIFANMTTEQKENALSKIKAGSLNI